MLQQPNKLNDDQLRTLHMRVTKDNVDRAKTYAYFVIVLELFMLIWNAVNYGISFHYYVQLYVAFLSVAVLTLFVLKLTNKIDATERRIRIQHRYLMCYYTFTLTWGVAVTLIDQASSYGHVTAYLTNYLVATVLFIIPKRDYVLLHLLPTTALVLGLLYFQPDSAILAGHFINITVFFIFATLGARFLYAMQAKNLLQELLLQQTNAEMELLNTHLASLVHHDELTRIANRRGLYSYVNTIIAAAPQSAAVYVLDIDAFKRYNDFYGHLAGDQALKQVAQAIEQTTASQQYFTARFGGEEFVVVAFHATAKAADDLAHDIFNAVAALHIPHEASPYHGELSISLGYTIGEIHDQASFEQLIKEADKALYAAKENGRNQFKATH